MASRDSVFAEFIEMVPDALVIVDRAGVIQLVNDAASKLFGYGDGELTGQQLGLLMPDRFAARHAEHVAGFNRNPRARAMAPLPGTGLWARRRDGTEFPVEIALKPTTVDGQPVIAAAIRDVTQFRALTEAARDGQERQSLMRLAKTGTWSIDLRTHAQRLSTELVELLEWSDAPRNLTEFLQRVRPEEQDVIRGAAGTEAGDALVFHGTVRFRHSSGAWLWFEHQVFLERDAAGVPMRLRGLAMDVTEKKRAEAEHNELREAMSQAIEGVARVDLAERIVSANGAFALMHGAHADALRGADWWATFAPKDRPELEAALARMRGEGRAHFEGTGQRPDGTQFPKETTMVAARDGAGTSTGHYCFARDLTEQRRLQDQLLTSDRMSSMGTLAAGVAHEINNPLAALTSDLDFALTALSGHAPELPQALEALGDARTSAERVRQIVRDIKMFSRPDELRVARVDVQRVIESSLGLVWNEIRHRARVEKRYGAAPMVLSNEARLGQVFVNLLVNAAHAMPEGAADTQRLTLTTGTLPSGEAFAEVRDTGSGMSAEVLKKIFDPFFTTKPIGIGTGLGLSICRRIVAELGGSMHVDSVLGEGSCFRVTLPPAPAEPPGPAQPPAPEAAVPARRGRILLVDDDVGVVRALARVLKSRHEVVSETRAADALVRLSAGEHFDLVISDVMMPEVTGAEFYEALRKFDPAQASRMIFMTGGAFTPPAAEFLDRVDNLRLDKPAEVTTLLALVARALG